VYVTRLPDGLPVVERDVVRIVLRDAGGRILLLRTTDPTYPELGTWWELPGGGIEAGETPVAAAVRELREETGIEVGTGAVGAPTWRRDATFRYRGTRHLQHESVLTIRLDVPGPDVDGSQRVGFEDEDYVGYRWWPVAAVVASGERFYPGRLPELLPAFLAGDRIDEPFEQWS
jgi:8-oxo-dGTP pyrophosphatase MutT (NUDIX family)